MKNQALSNRLVAMLAFFFFCVMTVSAQITVVGTVVDDMEEPVLGASILEKGTTNGIVTDLDGNFTLKVQKDAVLVVSYVGYLTQELKAEPKLSENSENLDEVVVIGYGTTKAKNFTGSVDQVKMSDSPVADLNLSSATDLLRGRL